MKIQPRVSYMSKNTHYQSPYKIRSSKQLPYEREKGSKDLLKFKDEAVNEEMRNSYDKIHATIPQGASKIPWVNNLLFH
jgi:hypothetical protein